MCNPPLMFLLVSRIHALLCIPGGVWKKYGLVQYLYVYRSSISVALVVSSYFISDAQLVMLLNPFSLIL